MKKKTMYFLDTFDKLNTQNLFYVAKPLQTIQIQIVWQGLAIKKLCCHYKG